MHRPFGQRLRVLGSVSGATVKNWLQRSASSGAATILSIQTGTVTIGSGATSGTATVTAVNLAKSVLIWNGYNGVSGVTLFSQGMVRLELTNTTTVTAIRAGTPASTDTVSFTLIEYVTGVLKSVQYISIANAAALTATQTIASVDLTKAYVLWLGQSTTDASAWTAGGPARLELTNATTVTATVQTGYTSTINGVVVEHN